MRITRRMQLGRAFVRGILSRCLLAIIPHFSLPTAAARIGGHCCVALACGTQHTCRGDVVPEADAARREARATSGAEARQSSAEKCALAEVSGFASRARSLLCKRHIGRQTANSEGAGDKTRHRAESRGSDSASRAVPTSAALTRSVMSNPGALRTIGAGLRSSAQRGGIWAADRLSRSVVKMVFIHSPLAYQPSPLGRRNRRLGGSRYVGLQSHAEPANRYSPIRHGPGGAAIVALCSYTSRLWRAVFGMT